MTQSRVSEIMKQIFPISQKRKTMGTMGKVPIGELQTMQRTQKHTKKSRYVFLFKYTSNLDLGPESGTF